MGRWFVRVEKGAGATDEEDHFETATERVASLKDSCVDGLYDVAEYECPLLWVFGFINVFVVYSPLYPLYNDHDNDNDNDCV